MIDFWEVFGRLATDKVLRGALYKRFPVCDYPRSKVDCGLVIPEPDYKDAREIIKEAIWDRPVSIMALGETLMCISQQYFRDEFADLIDAIEEVGVNTVDRSYWFYTALGLMVVDLVILKQFAAGVDAFDACQLGQLDRTERRDIMRLANDSTVVSQATAVCGIYWQQGCNDKYYFWQASPQLPHVHPAAADYPPTPTPKPASPGPGK